MSQKTYKNYQKRKGQSFILLLGLISIRRLKSWSFIMMKMIIFSLRKGLVGRERVDMRQMSTSSNK
jgi:hypothetical protein